MMRSVKDFFIHTPDRASSRELRGQPAFRSPWSRTQEDTMLVSVFRLGIQNTVKPCLAIVTPDDMAAEKLHALHSLGADVEQVRPASIIDKKQVGRLFRALEFHANHLTVRRKPCLYMLSYYRAWARISPDSAPSRSPPLPQPLWFPLWTTPSQS
jgi:hypothetical protein